jgi:demethylmenaquinone methyltransferase / 2-methoxy-6-polyprenyl-1,4-benzoquinol methylase
MPTGSPLLSTAGAGAGAARAPGPASPASAAAASSTRVPGPASSASLASAAASGGGARVRDAEEAGAAGAAGPATVAHAFAGPSAAGGGVDKSGSAIRAMFGQVARRYDLLNHLLSGGLDLLWRRRAAAALELPPGALVLDLCAGTGDQAIALSRRGARVAAADFCLPMLALARGKFRRRSAAGASGGGGAAAAAPRPRALAADALALPFPAGRFAAATVAFGLRNVADLDRALGQLAAALVPGGRLAVLECTVPRWAPLRVLYLLYFRRLLPLVGRLVSDSRSAYDYLPASVLTFPERGEFLDRMAAAGFADLSWRDQAGGTVCLYLGAVPPAPASGTPPPTASAGAAAPISGASGSATSSPAAEPPPRGSSDR